MRKKDPLVRTEEQQSFYKTQAWVKCRNTYLKSVGGLCELCKEHGLIRPAEIVHHKTPITIKNLDDPNITLNWDNLIALCAKHHAMEHRENPPRYIVDEYGRVIPRDDV